MIIKDLRQLKGNMFLPKIISGGMGVNTSCPDLARTVSMYSRPDKETLGTISGTALEIVMARMLKIGGKYTDAIRGALDDFPFKEVSERVIREYSGKLNRGIPVFSVNPSRLLCELTICANFAFVRMAGKEHNCPISINYLEKISMPHLFAIFGAMLAGVDFITMGAGIPDKIPAVIEAYSTENPATYKIPIVGEKEGCQMSFNPAEFFGKEIPQLKKPGFIPIIASNVLGIALKRAIPQGGIYGFVIEEPTAGGHNAPPRNKVDYSEKDIVDYHKIAELGLPFWIAGSYASPEKLAWAQSVGASGIQAGSIFALSRESGMQESIRKEIIKRAFNKNLSVRTDMRISPTGFPFKVVEMENTISDRYVYESRERVCDKGALVVLYRRPDGSIGYRCQSEPVEAYLRKGGKLEDTVGRGCICNGLIVKAGMQLKGENEPAVITLGDDTSFLSHLIQNEDDSYSATDALNYLFGV
jgi:nitronate monooxygenase